MTQARVGSIQPAPGERGVYYVSGASKTIQT